MKIQVIGLGYVGLPTAILLASAGYEVIGVDTNKNLLNSIKNGSAKIEDEKLQIKYKETISDKKLYVSDSIQQSDVHIIAVPTPVIDYHIDLRHIKSVCYDLSKVLKNNDLVIIESTISPGTTDGAIKEILEESGLKAGEDFYLSHIPERVQPGRLYQELTNNSRIVGGICESSATKAQEIYQSFVNGEFYKTDLITAETIKVVENTYRDINIAFANELLLVCEKIGVDPKEVINYANTHQRVNILNPGPGVGGHCIPVDPWFLVQLAPEESNLIKTARYRNDYMPKKVSEDIILILNSNNKVGDGVGIMGCSYKANTGDMRESPTEKILSYLDDANIKYNTYDPYFNHLNRWPSSLETIEESIRDIGLLVFVVPHDEFKRLNPKEIKKLTKAEHVLDCTGQINKGNWENAGFQFITFGNVKKYIDKINLNLSSLV